MTGQLLYRLTCQTQVDAVIQQFEFSGTDAAALLLQFSQQLAAAQAAQYAVNVQAGAVTDGIVLLSLDAISGLTDLVSVQKIFNSMRSKNFMGGGGLKRPLPGIGLNRFVKSFASTTPKKFISG